jgi:hypothetical protein
MVLKRFRINARANFCPTGAYLKLAIMAFNAIIGKSRFALAETRDEHKEFLDFSSPNLNLPLSARQPINFAMQSDLASGPRVRRFRNSTQLQHTAFSQSVRPQEDRGLVFARHKNRWVESRAVIGKNGDGPMV